MIQKEYFKTLTTKALLRYRRAWSCQYPRFDGDKLKGSWTNSGYDIDYDSLYEELSTRPHVASGKEAKLMRELRAKHHMTDKEIRENPKFRWMLAEAQKSECTGKIKERELHPLVKNVCVKLNLHPEHPDVLKEVIKIIDNKDLIFTKLDLKEVKQGKIYRYYDTFSRRYYYSKP